MVKKDIILKMKNPPPDVNIISYLEESINQIFNYIKKNISDDMKVGIVFNSASFIHGAGILSYRFLRYLTVDDIWNLIFKITQSRTEFKIDETFHIKICAVEIPRGLGRNKKSTLNRKNMRSIIQIRGNDNFCFPKALLVFFEILLR